MVEIKNLTKEFREAVILNDVSAKFEKGKIHGIIGRNGSGKTVLLKLICGLMKADRGAVIVDGKQVGKDVEVPPSLGAIIEIPGFLPFHSGRRNLEYLASLSRKADKKQVCEAMRLVGLDPASPKLVWKYSLGMKQRLGIAQAIMENPDLLILDEPLNSLDKKSAEDMRNLFVEFKKQGKTILLATHLQQDIQGICDTVYELDEGKINRVETQ